MGARINVVVTDRTLLDRLQAPCWTIVEEILPFGHGRLKFRIHRATGEPWFIETNLNCNLCFGKTLAKSAARLGISHAELIETILCHSLLRQGVIPEIALMAA